jgi:hypothetical protein
MIADRIKTFKRVAVADLIDNPKNWRKHPDAQRNALGGLLESVGWADAVLARETPDGLMLIDGHLRKELAADSKVPVLVLDVTEAEADLILATHDPLTSMAETDQALLDELVQGLDIENDETQKMLDELASDPVIEVVEDEVPELPEEPTTKTGDLFALGDHRLLCGDCTSADNVARLMDGDEIGVVATDPPYGINLPTNYATRGRGKIAKAKDYPPVVGDDKPFDPDFIITLNKPAIIWGANYFCQSLPPSSGWLVWDKKRPEGIDQADCELAWSNCIKGARIIQYQWHGCMREGNDILQHPTQKPVQVIVWSLSFTWVPTGIILDPFLGSGTTLIAAEQLGRKCYGMEISPAYCDVIIQRWENLTGKKAKKVK